MSTLLLLKIVLLLASIALFDSLMKSFITQIKPLLVASREKCKARAKAKRDENSEVKAILKLRKSISKEA